MNADGSNPVRLTEDIDNDVTNFVWIGDRELAYITLVGGVDTDLVARNADGSGRRVVAASILLVGALSASIPAGKVLFSRRVNNVDTISTINFDGTAERTVIPQGGLGVSFAPSGAKIAFQRGDDIFVINSDGTGEVNLTSNAADLSVSPRWPPDSSKLLFHRSIEERLDVFSSNLDGTGQTNITASPTVSESFTTISPDGNQIAFHDGTQVVVSAIDGLSPTPVGGTAGGTFIDWRPCQ